MNTYLIVGITVLVIFIFGLYYIGSKIVDVLDRELNKKINKKINK